MYGILRVVFEAASGISRNSLGNAGVHWIRGWKNGAAREIRTPDPLITNEVLYQLSYCGV
jgi:hypothetical protein